MGPINTALVGLFLADQKLREAQGRLDAVSKDARIQERKVNDLAEKLQVARARLKESQAQAGEHDLDLKSRDARIEKLRTQQQTAHTNREYQTFLVEINTEKLDRGKTEEQLLKAMEAVETQSAEAAELAKSLDAERVKLEAVKEKIGAKVALVQAEIDGLVPGRRAAAEAVPAAARIAFERLAEAYEGHGLSAVTKPHRQREEYACGACNMDLVTDVYNKLHTRDELVMCPSCRRILYIPDDLPVETAVKNLASGNRIVRAAVDRRNREHRRRGSNQAIDVMRSVDSEPEQTPPQTTSTSSDDTTAG